MNTKQLEVSKEINISKELSYLIVEYQKDAFASDFSYNIAKLMVVAKQATGGRGVLDFIQHNFKDKHVSADLKIILEETMKLILGIPNISLDLLLFSHDIYNHTGESTVQKIPAERHRHGMLTDDMQILLSNIGVKNTLRLIEILFYHKS